jgi:hypothetical protein
MAVKGPQMKIRITITDESDEELASRVFEIAGPHDYQQASDYMWKRLKEARAVGDDTVQRSSWGPQEVTGAD